MSADLGKVSTLFVPELENQNCRLVDSRNNTIETHDKLTL